MVKHGNQMPQIASSRSRTRKIASTARMSFPLLAKRAISTVRMRNSRSRQPMLPPISEHSVSAKPVYGASSTVGLQKT